jgi:very-short-patch-repair endonuclease
MKWKQEEINYVKKLYGKINNKYIAKKLKRTKNSITGIAFRKGFHSNLVSHPNHEGKNNTFYGKKHTKKSKKLIGLKSIGRIPSKKTLKKRSISLKKVWKNPNYKKRIKKIRIKNWKNNHKRKEQTSILMKKLWKNPEYIKKMKKRKVIAGMKGKHHTKKSKKLISIGNKGKKVSKKSREKIRKAHIGKTCSFSTRKKLRNRDYSYLKGNKNPMKKEKNLRKCIQSNFESPTLPERRLIQIIKINKLPFKFVGNGKLIIKGLCPDFVSKKTNHIIEVYGEYHHELLATKKRDKNRKQIYSSFGYKTLIIKSKKIYKNPQNVTERIINFYLS